MILNMTGGGVGLNFTVVGGTSAPASPSENTIWVNTSTTITGWIFSADTPSGASAGMVWIRTGTASAAAFEATKNNPITLYPEACYQYISGAWVAKEAKTYQSGGWVEWNIYLFKAGDSCEGMTGGWLGTSDGLSISGSTMTLTALNFGGSITYGAMYTAKKIDLTDVDVIRFTVSDLLTGDNLRYHYLGIFPAVPSGTSSDSASSMSAYISVSTTGEKLLDVSGISGTYYVGALTSGKEYSKSYLSFTEIYME